MITQRRLAAPAGPAHGVEAAGAPVQRQRHARRRLDRDAGQAGGRQRGVGREADGDVLPGAPGPAVQRAASRRTIEPGFHPSRDASQPTSSIPAAAESGWWRIARPEILPSSGRMAGGSNVMARRSRHGVVRTQARSTT